MNKHSVFNSFLLSVCLGVCAWVAHKSAESGERIAAMQASFEATKEAAARSDRANAEALVRMEKKLDETLPRREFDARLLLVEAEQRKLEIRIREIDLEILKLKKDL